MTRKPTYRRRIEAVIERLQSQGWDIATDRANGGFKFINRSGSRDLSGRFSRDYDAHVWLDGFQSATLEPRPTPAFTPDPTDDPDLLAAREAAAALDRRALMTRLAYLFDPAGLGDPGMREQLELLFDGLRGFTQMDDAELRETYAQMVAFDLAEQPDWTAIDAEWASWGEDYAEVRP